MPLRVSEYEIPEYEVFKNIFNPAPISAPGGAAILPPPVRSLLKSVREYHEIDKRTSGFVYPRINKLAEIERALHAVKQNFELGLRMHAPPSVPPGSRFPILGDIQLLIENTGKRKAYLSKLREYLSPEKKATITALVNVFSQQSVVRVTANKMALPRHAHHTGLHQTKILEKYEPRGRGAADWMMGAFTAYVRDEMNAGKDPSVKLVDFFLGLELDPGYRALKGNPYWTKEEAAWREIWFEGGRAFTCYVKKVRSATDYVYLQYDPVLHTEYIPHTYWLHSLKNGQAVLPSGETITVKYGYQLPDRGKDPDLADSFIYVMRKGRIIAYPPKQEESESLFHSFGFQGKKIQAAGLLVAVDGQIRAIDNRSGHYRPSLKFLSQAVEEINRHNAFSDDALVGVAYSYKGVGGVNELVTHNKPDTNTEASSLDKGNSAFFTLAIFLDLFRKGFNLAAVWEAFNQMQSRYRSGPTAFPQHSNQVWAMFARRWAEDSLTWSRVRNDFIAYFYPGYQEFVKAITKIVEGRTIPTPEKFKKDTNWTFHRRSGFGAIDEALRAYAVDRDRLAQTITRDNMYAINLTIENLKRTFFQIMRETEAWTLGATAPGVSASRGQRKAVEDLHVAASQQYSGIGSAVARMKTSKPRES